MLLVPLAETASAAFGWDPIDCCCGEHAGDEACGCPDCPAGHQDDHDDDGEGQDDGTTPGFRSCGVTSHVSLPGAFAEAILPVAPVLIAPPARVAPRAEAARPPPSLSSRPEKPPS
jgi:hypothetical protein